MDNSNKIVKKLNISITCLSILGVIFLLVGLLINYVFNFETSTTKMTMIIFIILACVSFIIVTSLGITSLFKLGNSKKNDDKESTKTKVKKEISQDETLILNDTTTNDDFKLSTIDSSETNDLIGLINANKLNETLLEENFENKDLKENTNQINNLLVNEQFQQQQSLPLPSFKYQEKRPKISEFAIERNKFSKSFSNVTQQPTSNIQPDAVNPLINNPIVNNADVSITQLNQSLNNNQSNIENVNPIPSQHQPNQLDMQAIPDSQPNKLEKIQVPTQQRVHPPIPVKVPTLPSLHSVPRQSVVQNNPINKPPIPKHSPVGLSNRPKPTFIAASKPIPKALINKPITNISFNTRTIPSQTNNSFSAQQNQQKINGVYRSSNAPTQSNFVDQNQTKNN